MSYSAATASPRCTLTPAPAISTTPVGVIRSKAFPSTGAISDGHLSYRGQQGSTVATATM